jgi:iron-sulfur cluster repair protein YtfE (RIC family)
MYVMHHALRRDLERFSTAVRATPVTDQPVWEALERRWRRVAELLHHHHSVEDSSLWPVLRSHASGQPEDLRLLDAMEEEHGHLGPALESCRTGFAAMREHPCEDHRSALVAAVTALRDGLLEHLAHEEGHALPLLQRSLSEEENAAFERAAEKGYPLRVVPFALCWVMDELPAEARERILATTPPGYGLLLRLLGRRYGRDTGVAFRHVR